MDEKWYLEIKLKAFNSCFVHWYFHICMKLWVFLHVKVFPTWNYYDFFYLQQLIRNLDRDLQYAISTEGKMDVDSISNYEDVKKAILDKVPSNLVLQIFLFIIFAGVPILKLLVCSIIYFSKKIHFSGVIPVPLCS